MNFNKTPFVRLAIPLILGIILALYIEISVFISLTLLFLSLGFLTFFYFSPLSKKNIFSYFNGSLLFVFFFFSGMYLSEIREIKKATIDNETEYEYIAIIDETIDEKEKSVKTILKIEKNLSITFENHNYKVLTYFEKNASTLNLKYGDRLLIKARIQAVENAGNPNEFDYAAFLARKGIFYQTYLKSENLQILEHDKGNIVFALAHKARGNLLQIYKDYDIKGAELAVLSALTLGYKSYLDRETKSAFSESGAMHVLAVSGLHVGIILGILMMFFKPFTGNKKIRYLKLIIIIVSLWSFALLSGLSPSVRRAALMFSFVAIGDFINRPNSIYNSLFASASILLLYNPGNFFDVGFQLSYLAVFSIVALQPIIYRSIFIPTWLGKHVWTLASVSIAAQLGTMPIGLFYFHQFPTYFILTNIFVIPLAFIIIYLALALLLSSGFAFLAKIIAFVLNWVLFSLNYIVTFIKNMPFSSIKAMELQLFEVIFLYIFIVFLFSYFFLQKKIYLNLSLAFLLIVSTTNVFGNYYKSEKNHFVVFNIRKSTLINLATNTENLVVCDTTLKQNSNFIDFAADNFWIENNLPLADIFDVFETENIKANSIHFKNDFILFKGKRIGILGYNDLRKFSTQKPIVLDLLILSNNSKIKMEEIEEYFSVKKIVIDSSNSLWRIEKWLEEAEKLNINLHIVASEGAFVWELE